MVRLVLENPGIFVADWLSLVDSISPVKRWRERNNGTNSAPVRRLERGLDNRRRLLLSRPHSEIGNGARPVLLIDDVLRLYHYGD
jgi:hypothetical protein